MSTSTYIETRDSWVERTFVPVMRASDPLYRNDESATVEWASALLYETSTPLYSAPDNRGSGAGTIALISTPALPAESGTVTVGRARHFPAHSRNDPGQRGSARHCLDHRTALYSERQ